MNNPILEKAMEESFDERLERIVGDIELAENFEVRIGLDELQGAFGRRYFQIRFWRKDVITGEMGYGYGGKAYLSEHASDSELVQTIFGLYKGYWEHEARETFQWRGRRVFGPHIATEALWEVAKRVDVRSAKHVEDKPVEKGVFGIGDRVTWVELDVDSSVYGIVDDVSVVLQEVRVAWADGSGPTWHRSKDLVRSRANKLNHMVDETADQRYREYVQRVNVEAVGKPLTKSAWLRAEAEARIEHHKKVFPGTSLDI